MFESFTEWFFKPAREYETKRKPNGKLIAVWVDADSGKKVITSYLSSDSFIPSIGSTFIIGKRKGTVLKTHYNYNTDTSNGDHVAIKIVFREIMEIKN